MTVFYPIYRKWASHDDVDVSNSHSYIFSREFTHTLYYPVICKKSSVFIKRNKIDSDQ